MRKLTDYINRREITGGVELLSLSGTWITNEIKTKRKKQFFQTWMVMGFGQVFKS